MNLEEYAERQRRLTSGLSAWLLRVLTPYAAPALVPRAWGSVITGIFWRVREARRESARLGREFYDSQRRAHGADRRDVLLADYKQEWLAEALEPVRERFLQADSYDALNELILRVNTQVENGGRRTLLNVIDDEWEDEPEPEVVAWARVATGRETCAFCMMLVSRGPVYLTAENAGLDLDDTSAVELWQEGDEAALDELARRWHPGCDCKVVPVFDRANWPGRDAYLKAEKLWKETTKGYSGRDALNALRRALNKGDVSARDFAAIAA